MTIDVFVLLTPILLLGVMALLGFVGCASLLGVDDVTYASATTTPSVTLAVSPEPSVVGQQVTLTATVKQDTGNKVPTGNVTFQEGVSTLGTVALDNSGVATLQIVLATAGAHFLTANYGGDTSFDPHTGDVLHIVNAAPGTTPTTTTLTVSPNPAFLGQQVNCIAIVTAGGGTPGGNVDFKEGAGPLAPGATGLPLNAAGVATFGTSTLAAGPHSVVAVYGGNTIFAGSQSAPVPLTVKPTPPPPLKVTHVQTQANFLGAGGASISLSVAATKGNLILVTVAWQYSAAPTTVAVADGANVYQSAVQSGWGTNRVAQTFFAFNSAATGILNIKATPSAPATELRLVVSEYANASAAPLDGTGKQTGAGTTIGPATFTTTAMDDLIYAVAVGTGAAGTISPSAGFTNRTPAGQTNMLVEEAQAAGTAQSAGGTDSVAAGASVILALAIKHA